MDLLCWSGAMILSGSTAASAPRACRWLEVARLRGFGDQSDLPEHWRPGVQRDLETLIYVKS